MLYPLSYGRESRIFRRLGVWCWVGGAGELKPYISGMCHPWNSYFLRPSSNIATYGREVYTVGSERGSSETGSMRLGGLRGEGLAI